MSKDQRRQDIKYTDTTLGRIAFSSLRTDHLEEVKVELEEHLLTVPDDSRIKACVTMLREHLKKEHGIEYEKSFYPKTEGLKRIFPFAVLKSDQHTVNLFR